MQACIRVEGKNVRTSLLTDSNILIAVRIRGIEKPPYLIYKLDFLLVQE